VIDNPAGDDDAGSFNAAPAMHEDAVAGGERVVDRPENRVHLRDGQDADVHDREALMRGGDAPHLGDRLQQ